MILHFFDLVLKILDYFQLFHYFFFLFLYDLIQTLDLPNKLHCFRSIVFTNHTIFIINVKPFLFYIIQLIFQLINVITF